MKRLLTAAGAACVALYASTWRAEATSFLQTNLVSDLSGLATITDPFLQNPWGISHSPASPFWVSNQFTSTATLYGVTGSTTVTKVNTNPATPGVPVVIPFDPTATGPQGPTGTVFNSAAAPGVFPVPQANNAPALFMFANLNGTISAWNPAASPTATFNQVTTPGAIYTGLALATPPNNQALLYAANDAGTGSINVFDSSFHQAMGLPPGAFATPAAISARGLVPFNVQVLNGLVYVTYAHPGTLPRQMPPLARELWRSSIWTEVRYRIQLWWLAAPTSPRHGVLLLLQRVSVSLGATCWSAILAVSTSE
jgi:uncharacterized protein (TIGR03118 family)